MSACGLTPSINNILKTAPAMCNPQQTQEDKVLLYMVQPSSRVIYTTSWWIFKIPEREKQKRRLSSIASLSHMLYPYAKRYFLKNCE